MGLRSEDLRKALNDALAGRPSRLGDLLARHGGLPGPHPNAGLAAAFGEAVAEAGKGARRVLDGFREEPEEDSARTFLPIAAAYGHIARFDTDSRHVWEGILRRQVAGAAPTVPPVSTASSPRSHRSVQRSVPRVEPSCVVGPSVVGPAIGRSGVDVGDRAIVAVEERSVQGSWTVRVAAVVWALSMWPTAIEAQCSPAAPSADGDASGRPSGADPIRYPPLIEQAVRHHSEAQGLRRQSPMIIDRQRDEQAHREYEIAARAYRAYLRACPDDPDAYELRYHLADALFWSDHFEEAAQAYAEVRDSPLDDRYLSESARRVVESLHRLVEQAEERGELHLRSDPPEPTGEPPRVTPIQLPPLLQRLFEAREIYLARVPEAEDVERVRAGYELEDALLFFYYGRWPSARHRFLQIYDTRCSGPAADDTGRVAWEKLRDMAIAFGDIAEAERLSRQVLARGCTFGHATEQDVDAFCSRPEQIGSPECIAD